jgi:outer membrane receptor protein involved in Fe transport
MKHLLLLFLSGLLSASAMAQTVTVRGKLVSSGDNNELPFATISVANEDAPRTAIQRFATDANGTFSTTLNPGTYIFTFHFVGMNELKKTVEVPESPSTLNLGEIALSEASTELEEVSVVAQRPLVRVEIDRIAYSVQDDPEASVSSVLDVLRKVPMISVDGEDNILLRGNSNFRIHLNGKPSNMISNNPREVLRSMPASSIKDIEVITDPGARHDAEGVAGIINIITNQRVDDGYTGTVGANANSQGSYGGNAYLSARYGKFGLTGNVSHFQFRSPESTSWSERTEDDNVLTQTGTGRHKGHGTFGNLMLSFEPDTLNLFSVSLNQFGQKFNSPGNMRIVSQGARDFAYSQLRDSEGQWGNFSINTDYQRSFKKKDELLTVSYRWQNTPNDGSSWFNISNVEGAALFPDGYRQRNNNRAQGNEHTGQIDYTNPLTKNHVIEIGAKYIYRNNFSESENEFFNILTGLWELIPMRASDLDHQQHITSGYTGYTYRADKFSARAGVRFEHTDQTVKFADNDPFSANFFDVVPSATFSYRLKPTTTFRLGYTNRISRPGIWHLNPHVNDVDPTNISYGNPNLDSEVTHTFNLNYSQFAQKFSINASFNYSFSNNTIQWYRFMEDGVTHNTVGNIGQRQSAGMHLSGNWSPIQMLRINFNTGINYIDMQGGRVVLENGDVINVSNNSGFQGNGNTNMTLTLPKNWRLVANAGLFSPWIGLQNRGLTYQHWHSFNVMKSLFNRKLDVSLGAQSPFMKEFTFKNESWGDGFHTRSHFTHPRRSFSISATYRFGELRAQVRRVQRSITNDDVMQGGGGESGGGQQ